MKKVLSLIMALALLAGMISAPPAAAAEPVKDAPSGWAVEHVNRANALNLVPANLNKGYAQTITRAEFCALAAVLYEKIKDAEITGRKTFDDTDDVNVQKMGALGVVAGVGDNMFDPDGTLTREQAATILAKLADATGNPLAQTAAAFADGDKIAPWALEAVGKVRAAEIMSGVGNNMFEPKGPCTREQGITAALRMYDFILQSLYSQAPPRDAVKPEAGSSIPVLLYHGVSDDFWGDAGMFVRVEDMEKQLEYLVSNGYTTITFDDLDSAVDDLDSVGNIKKPVMLTFDDGYRDNYENLFPLLKKYNVKATIFVFTYSIGYEKYLTRQQIREMSDSGLVSFQSHSCTHKGMDTLTNEALKMELRDSAFHIEQMTGKRPVAFAYPYGRYNNEVLEAVSQIYTYAVTTSYSSYTARSKPLEIGRFVVSRETTMNQFESLLEASV